VKKLRILISSKQGPTGSQVSDYITDRFCDLYGTTNGQRREPTRVYARHDVEPASSGPAHSR
jgi:hypothetical protein